MIHDAVLRDDCLCKDIELADTFVNEFHVLRPMIHHGTLFRRECFVL